jgi:phytanoyl-CoA hydroxylase
MVSEIGPEIDRVHAGYDGFKARYPLLHKLGEWSIRNPQMASPAIRALIYSKENLTVATDFIGADTDFYWCTTAAKPKERGRGFPWHQDAGYGEGPKDYFICWAAFDDADEDNGCIWVIPGSHRDGVLPHEYRKSDERNYAGVFLREAHPREPERLAVPIKAGDVICMHSQLVHATMQNSSPRQRRALVYAFIKGDHSGVYNINGSTEVIEPFSRDGKLVFSDFQSCVRM